MAVRQRPALAICGLLATALLGGAFAMEYFADLAPCKLCLWQRWPHAAVIVLAGIGFSVPLSVSRRRVLLALCAFAFAVTAAIGFYHAGVEYGLLQGPSSCTGLATGNSLDELRRNLMNAPVVRCDETPWALFGISLAGYNFLASGAAAVFAAVAALRRKQD
jgi:disulfide bond formation protein DsbB